jgi:hypothetical protein
MTKTRLTTLAKMEEPALRAWLRKAWDAEYPNQVSAWYDEWESRMWERVAFKKDDSGTLEREEYLMVRNLSRKITNTILGQPPYQAIRP